MLIKQINNDNTPIDLDWLLKKDEVDQEAIEPSKFQEWRHPETNLSSSEILALLPEKV